MKSLYYSMAKHDEGERITSLDFSCVFMNQDNKNALKRFGEARVLFDTGALCANYISTYVFNKIKI